MNVSILAYQTCKKGMPGINERRCPILIYRMKNIAIYWGRTEFMTDDDKTGFYESTWKIPIQKDEDVI